MDRRVLDGGIPSVETMFEPIAQPRDARTTYRVRRLAYFLCAAGVACSSLTYFCVVMAYLGMSRQLIQVLNSPIWEWTVATPSIFLSFLGCVLLIGRDRDISWQRRALLLTGFQLYFLGYWCLDHAELLGWNAAIARNPGDDVRWVVGRFLAFAAILTLSGMAHEEAQSLGWAEATPLWRAAVAACSFGLGFWCLYAGHRFDWENPWPPQFLGVRNPETIMIMLAALLARAIAGFFTVLLCANSCTLCSRELDRIEKSIRDSDPFHTPAI